MNLAVFLPNWVGDVAMATPALRALREHFPGAHISAVLKPYVAGVLEGCPWIDDWLPLHDWSVDQVWGRIRASGVPHHPAYELGMPRLSCCFCIFSPRSALLLVGLSACRSQPDAPFGATPPLLRSAGSAVTPKQATPAPESPPPPWAEALRGTFDPGYLNYTLGKLQILKLLDDYKAQQGDEFSLQKFHNELLNHGMPPIRLLRELILKDKNKWDEVL